MFSYVSFKLHQYKKTRLRKAKKVFFSPVSVLRLTAKLHLFIDFCNYQLLFQIVLKFLFLYQKFGRYHLLGLHMIWQHSERLWLYKVRSCWPNWDHRGWKKKTLGDCPALVFHILAFKCNANTKERPEKYKKQKVSCTHNFTVMHTKSIIHIISAEIMAYEANNTEANGLLKYHGNTVMVYVNK